MSAPMTFTVSIVNGEKVVTDENGNQYPWVDSVDVVLMPGGQPMLYIGTTNFTTTFTVGTPAAPGTVTSTPTTAHPA